MTRTIRRGVLVTAVVLVAAACTGGVVGPADRTSSPVASTTTAGPIGVPSTDTVGDAPSTTSSVPATMPGDIPAFQRALLEDGVTFAEYESAVLAAAACIEQHGFEVYGPFTGDQLPRGKVYAPGSDPSQRYSLGVVTPDTASAEIQNAARSALDDCQTEYLDYVDAAWDDVVAPSEEDLNRFYTDLVACLRGNGFDIDEPWTRWEIDDLFGLPGFDACY